MIKNSCKVRSLNPQISDGTIKCYKIFKISSLTNEYIGPFTNYCFGFLNAGDVIYAKDSITPASMVKQTLTKLFNKLNFTAFTNKKSSIYHGITYNKEHNWYDITSGFIHTLPYYPDNFKSYCDDYGIFELWECEIPKTTLYFQADCRGSHYEANGTYASKSLKLVKRMARIHI